MTDNRRRKAPPPTDYPLTQERSSRAGLTLMRPVESETGEAITLDHTTTFAIIPGDKGHGWILRVFEDPPPET